MSQKSKKSRDSKKSQEGGESSASGAKWALIGGAAAAGVAVTVVCILMFTGGGAAPKPDPSIAMNAARAELVDQVKKLMADSEFDAAARAIDAFLQQYPNAPQAARLLASKIVCHRKGGDLTGALLTVATLSEKFQSRGGDLCDAGDVLEARGCFQDAAKAFELASGDTSVRLRACYHAAICNYRLGRFGAAMKYIDVVAALKPNDPKVIAAVKRIEDARFSADR